ncbi:coat protein [ssRNA phage SRR6960509_16]|uniref:Coat protein n=1 Tax=ssRNA phage SRR6960509_16 TaxID=2786527 RepID=A0A8S5L039_9VIRU|nr:coat protein [ssRNA phage SRR6960509_16]DAD50993.1 TPA_asm: coat protein [ssRNA phage SRR6960509_16]
MFADPQSVTVNAVAQSLPAIKREDFSSSYRKDDGSYSLIISHAEGKRNRRVVRLEHRKIAADPLTADNVEYSTSVYLVMDAPPVGYTNTELKDIALGLTAWLSSTNVLKVLGGES